MIQVKGTLVNFAKGGELFPEDNMLKSPPKPKPKAVLWRYMSFEKYIDVLINRGVFFSYPGRLRDPFEGMVPPLTRKRLYEWLIQKHKAPVHQFDEIVNIFIHTKKKKPTHRFLLARNGARIGSHVASICRYGSRDRDQDHLRIAGKGFQELR